MAWTNQTKATYGSITSFLCKERLQWQLASPEKIPSFDIDSPIAFESPKDYKILLNDWPYGISPDITHLIVWSKIRIPARKPEGYLTAESVALVEDFVRRTFVEPLASSRSVEGL